MPRIPFYSGAISNRVQSAYGPTASVGDTLAPALSSAVAGKGGLLSRLFGPDPNDPEAAQAAYYRAKTDEVNTAIADAKDKTRRRQEGDTSVRNFADAGVDISEGGPRAVLGGYTTEGGGDDQSPSKLLPVFMREYALAAGRGDKESQERLSPVLQALVTSTGDPNAIITMNSGMGFDNKYIKGANGAEAATGTQQQQQIDADYAHNTENEVRKDQTQRYGIGVESGDRRYNTNVDAGTQRRGQDISAGTARRGQDLDANTAHQSKVMDVWNSAYNSNLAARMPKQTTTVVREAGKPVKSSIRTEGVPHQPAARAAAPPDVVPAPAQRTRGRVYQTPRGPMTWTGTGWTPAAGS